MKNTNAVKQAFEYAIKDCPQLIKDFIKEEHLEDKLMEFFKKKNNPDQFNGQKIHLDYSLGDGDIEPMKQYHFEREKFCDAFTHTFGENDTIDFINGVFGKKKEAQSGFDYQTLNFKCFWIDEDYHILDLETGVLIVWYKGLHLGRCNMCSRPDFTLDDFEKMLTKLHTELIETYM